jgi:hypothetical protein
MQLSTELIVQQMRCGVVAKSYERHEGASWVTTIFAMNIKL